MQRGEQNRIYKMDQNEVIFNMMEQTVRRLSMQDMDKMLSTMDVLLREVPVYRLECNMEPEAAILSYETMSGEKLSD